MNLQRRHLTDGQKAVLALDVLPHLESQAKARMEQGGTELIPEGSQGEAREQAAALVGTNPRYVSDAKRLQGDAPDLLERVRSDRRCSPGTCR